MKWLDDYIDRMYERESQRKRPAWAGKVPPQFTRPGSIFNAVVSSALVVFAVITSLTRPGFEIGLFVAAIGLALAVIFIRIAVRVFLGDFKQN